MASTSLLLSVLVLLLLVAATCPAALSSSTGFRAHMTHVDSTRAATGDYSKLDVLRSSVTRSLHRQAWLQKLQCSAASPTGSPASSPSVTIPVHPGQGEFLMDLAIGTPALPFSAIVDTGSDLIWTQCQPCQHCFNQSTPVFDPTTSATFSAIPCSDGRCRALPMEFCDDSSTDGRSRTSWGEDMECQYTYTYGDSSMTKGVLGSETLTFLEGGGGGGNVSLPAIAFGCGSANSGFGSGQGAGLVGMGRGPLSLVSQLKLGRFAYCLTSYGTNSTSPLLFGSLATFNNSAVSLGAVQTMAFVSTPSTVPTFFYLPLKSITVGKTVIPVPPATAPSQTASNGGGFIIDSGTTITTLEMSLYEPVKEAFLKQMLLPVAPIQPDHPASEFDLCWVVSNPLPAAPTTTISAPRLSFHFDGADLELPVENYLVGDSNGSGETHRLCLAMAGTSGDLSILGNFQQQGFLMLYDLDNEQLSFAPAKCGDL